MPSRTDWTGLDGKRCLITGGSSGIGRAIVTLLYESEARIVTCGRSEEKLRLLKSKIGDDGQRLEAVQADVAQSEDLARLFNVVERRLGGLDILITNAAVARESVTARKKPQFPMC